MNKRVLLIGLRWLLAIALLWMGLAKFWHPEQGSMFAAQPKPVQIAVIVTELVLAGWLAVGWRAVWSALGLIVLLSAFSGVIAVELRKPQPRPCGCGAAVVSAANAPQIRRSLIVSLSTNGLLMAGLALVYLGRRRGPLPGSAAGPGEPLTAADATELSPVGTAAQ